MRKSYNRALDEATDPFRSVYGANFGREEKKGKQNTQIQSSSKKPEPSSKVEKTVRYSTPQKDSKHMKVDK